MNNEYKIIHYYDVKRLIMQIKIDKIKDIETLVKNLSENIAYLLDSKILFEKLYFFDNYHKNFTYLVVLSTSHIVISSYFSDEYKVLDIDVSWCSGKDISITDLNTIFSRVFGEKFSILSLKYLDHKGEELKI